MTDMPETHTARSLASGDPRTLFVATFDAAQRLIMAATAYVHGPKTEDARALAERAQRADRLREDARRKVDRLMM